MSDPTWYVLVHDGHGRTSLDREQFSTLGTRMLNVHGRWSGGPSQQAPVLCWASPDEAAHAAERCSKSREISVSVHQMAGSAFALGKNLVAFDASHEAALHGYLPLSQMDAIKRNATRPRVLAAAAYLVGKHLNDERLLTASRTLASKAGVGAADFLLGKTGRPVAEAIVDGEMADDPSVSRATVLAGMALALALVSARGRQELSAPAAGGT